MVMIGCVGHDGRRRRRRACAAEAEDASGEAPRSGRSHRRRDSCCGSLCRRRRRRRRLRRRRRFDAPPPSVRRRRRRGRRRRCRRPLRPPLAMMIASSDSVQRWHIPFVFFSSPYFPRSTRHTVCGRPFGGRGNACGEVSLSYKATISGIKDRRRNTPILASKLRACPQASIVST